MKLLDATLQAGVPIENVAQWYRLNGVNERTFYRHRARVAAEGAWSERSRRPRSSPTATPDWLVARIVALRAELAPDNGADNIHAALLDAAGQGDWPGGVAVPARATINRVLGRADLLERNPRKRPRSSYRRFAYAGRGTVFRSMAPSTPPPTAPWWWRSTSSTTAPRGGTGRPRVPGLPRPHPPPPAPPPRVAPRGGPP